MTSQQAVSRVKRELGVKKAGHAGTLDPMATGVLVIGLGKATRLLGYILGHDKGYSATIRLGSGTTTDDGEGEPIGEARDASALDRCQIEAAMSAFVGTIAQKPSAVSAIKVDGRRAYAMVRAGEKVDLPAREVHVRAFSLGTTTVVGGWMDLEVEVECSSGTYIRALARDLGQALGVGGHLTRLRRTWVAGFPSTGLSTLDSLSDPGTIWPSAEVASWLFPTITVGEAMSADIAVGRAIPLAMPGDPTAILSEVTQGSSAPAELLALYRPAPDIPDHGVPVAVFVSSVGSR